MGNSISDFVPISLKFDQVKNLSKVTLDLTDTKKWRQSF